MEDKANGAEDNKYGSKKMLDETETPNEKEQEDGRDGAIDVERTEVMGSLGKEAQRKRENAHGKKQDEADNMKGNKRKKTDAMGSVETEEDGKRRSRGKVQAEMERKLWAEEKDRASSTRPGR